MALPPSDRNYRLPQSIRPLRYDATLSIDLARGTFGGRIRISLSVEREAAGIRAPCRRPHGDPGDRDRGRNRAGRRRSTRSRPARPSSCPPAT